MGRGSRRARSRALFQAGAGRAGRLQVRAPVAGGRPSCRRECRDPLQGCAVTRVLIIDDEPGVRAALVQLFEYEKAEARAVGSGPEGIAVYEEWRPAVTFLDVKMAGMDG